MNERLLREWISTLLVEQSKTKQLKFNAGNATEGLVAAALGAVIRNHGDGKPGPATKANMLDIINGMSGNSSQFPLASGDTLTVSFDLAAAELKAIKKDYNNAENISTEDCLEKVKDELTNLDSDISKKYFYIHKA